MSVTAFLVLLIIAAVVGAIAEAVVGYRTRWGWLGTILIGLIGAWLGTALIAIGPVIGGVHLISAILGAIILVLILKALARPRRTL